jgi:hypothetical protein
MGSSSIRYGILAAFVTVFSLGQAFAQSTVSPAAPLVLHGCSNLMAVRKISNMDGFLNLNFVSPKSKFNSLMEFAEKARAECGTASTQAELVRAAKKVQITGKAIEEYQVAIATGPQLLRELADHVKALDEVGCSEDLKAQAHLVETANSKLTEKMQTVPQSCGQNASP